MLHLLCLRASFHNFQPFFNCKNNTQLNSECCIEHSAFMHGSFNHCFSSQNRFQSLYIRMATTISKRNDKNSNWNMKKSSSFLSRQFLFSLEQKTERKKKPRWKKTPHLIADEYWICRSNVKRNKWMVYGRFYVWHNCLPSAAIRLMQSKWNCRKSTEWKNFATSEQ